MAEKNVSTVLTQDKVCKSCVRFVNAESKDVTTSMYLANEAYEKLDKPESIKVVITKEA